jgi:hypothetical protein
LRTDQSSHLIACFLYRLFRPGSKLVRPAARIPEFSLEESQHFALDFRLKWSRRVAVEINGHLFVNNFLFVKVLTYEMECQ